MDIPEEIQDLHELAKAIYDAGPDSFQGEHGFSHLLTAMALELQEHVDAIQTQLALLEQPEVLEQLRKSLPTGQHVS